MNIIEQNNNKSNSVALLRVNPIQKNLKHVKKPIGLRALFFIAVIFITANFGIDKVDAATITVNTSKSWSTLTGGGGPGGLPSATDIVQVQTTVTLTVDINTAVCASITVGNGNNNNTNPVLKFNNGSQLTVSGNVTFGQGSGSNREGSLDMTLGGKLILSGAITIGNLGTFSAGTGTIEFNASGPQTLITTLGAFNNLTLSGSGVKTVTGTTVNGILSRQGTATVTGTPTYGASATLEYKGSAAQTTGSEWPAPATNFAGSGGVLINNASGVTLGAARTITGASQLIIGSTVSNSVFNDGGFQLTCTGPLTITSGTFNLGTTGTATTFPAFSSRTYSSGTTVAFVATVAQTVAATTYPNLTFSGAGAKTTATGTVTISENWSTTGGAATLNTNNSNVAVTGNITGAGNITSGSGTISIGGNWTNNGTFTAGTGTVDYNGAAQTVAVLSYNNLTFSGSGIKTTNAGTITVASNWAVSAGTAGLNTNNTNVTVTGSITGSGDITSGSGTITISGSWTNNGTFTSGTGTVLYNGASPSIATLTYYNLTTTPLSGGTSLAGTIDVNNVLTISSSTLNLLSNNLNIGASGSITITSPSASKMIIASGTGKVRKSFSGNGSFTFPIGDNTGTPEYSPVTITVTGSAYNSAYVEVNVTNSKHPDNASATHFISRYWNITQSGITGASANVTGTYVAADINGTEASASAAQLNGTFNQTTNPWIKFSALSSSTLTATGASLTDGIVSAFTGITGAAPTAAVTGGNVTVCPNVPVALSTNVTGDGTFIYSWSPSTGLSSSTVSNPTATVATTTGYTVTAIDGNGITATDNTTITIDPGTLATMPGGITGNIITCNGATGVQYSVQPAPNAVAYNWTVPAGASVASGAGTRIITVDFPNPYNGGTICVVAENACAIPTASRCLTISNVADFTPNRISGPINICPNTVGIVYTALAVNGSTNYNWTLPAGMTITAGAGTQTITVDAGLSVTPGSMCVSVDNACGTSLVYCRNINVNSATQPGGITGPSGICANNSGVVYSVQPVSGSTSYTWTVPAGFNIISGLGTRIITVDIGPTPSGGNVCVSANFSCGSSIPRCLPVSINGAVPGTISGPTNFCAGASGLAYSVADVPDAIAYNWTFPAGITQVSGGTTRSITVDVSPSFTTGNICVTVTSPCGTSSPSCRTLSDFSVVLPGAITGPNVVCQNTSGIVYSISTVAGAVSYNWIVPQGMNITAGSNTKSITVSIDNTFTIGDIGVRAVSSCGSQSLVKWNTKITTINPGMSGTISASTDICPSSTVNFSISAITGASTYAWTLPAGMSFTVGPPTNTNSISVDIGAGFTQGEICVNPVTVCGVEGNMKCQTFNIIPATPGAITGPSGICPGAAGVNYSVSSAAGASTYTWELPQGWSITGGSGTSSIIVSVPIGFVQGQIRVYGVSSCGQKGRMRVLNVNYIPATPGVITGSTAVCNGNTYIYSVTSVSGASSYDWTLPNGLTFTVGPPSNTNSVSVDVNGSFVGGDICVTASTLCGGPSAQRCLTIGTTPATPGAIDGPAAVCQGATSLSYSITALSGISTYNWTVPAGINIVSGQGTTNLVVDIGGGFTSGQICVTAQNACGTPGASSCLNITLTPATPTLITPAVNFCPGSTRTLTVSDVSGATSYTWTVPAGITILYGQGASTIMVAVDGSFVSGNVCVTAFTSCGAPSAQYCEVMSTSPAATPSTINASSIICAGSDILFSVPTVTGAGSFTWSLPSGLNIVSGQGSATLHANADPGFTSGSVCVTANSGCNSASTQTCQIFSTTPVQPGNITAPSTVCSNDPEVIFSVSPVLGVSSYNWVVPPQMTITSGLGSCAITVSVGAGFSSGQVSVTAVSACAIQGPARTITVGESATTPGVITTPVSICANSAGLVFSIPQVTTAVSYNWTVPAQFTIISGANTNTITCDVGPGFTSGQICVSSVSDCGTISTQNCKTLNSLPGMPGSITGQTKGVCNTVVQYSVPAVTFAASYTWTPPANASITSGQGTRIVQVTFSNAFVSGQLQVYASNACGNSTVRTSAVITGAPEKPTVITGLNSVCANQTAVAYSVPAVFNTTTYNWTVPAGATVATGQGTTNITVDWGTTAGNVSVTTTNTCGTSAATILGVAINCRITSSVKPETNLSVYPNPALEEFVVRFDATIESNYQFELVDLSGRIVLSKTVTSAIGNNMETVDVRSLPRGAYILKINNENIVVGNARVILQ